MSCDFEVILNKNPALRQKLLQLPYHDQIAALYSLACDMTNTLVPDTECDPMIRARDNASCMRCFSDAEIMGMVATLLCEGSNPAPCSPPVLGSTALPDGIIGTAYNATIPTLGRTGTNWTLQSGTSLPAGLSLDRGTGHITGTPTGPNAVTSFVVRAANQCGQDSEGYSISVTATCQVPEIKSSGNIACVVGVPMVPFFPDTTGTSPLTFTITSGTLPAGLALNSATGEISGTATEAGTFPIRLTATNVCGSDDSDYTVLSSRPHILWGNFVGPVPNLFTAAQIQALPPRGGGEFAPSSRAAPYEFQPNSGEFQVFFFPDSYLPPVASGTLTFKVNGQPLPLRPANDTAYQSLTVAGVPGKVFVTANTNAGGFTVANNNPVIVT